MHRQFHQLVTKTKRPKQIKASSDEKKKINVGVFTGIPVCRRSACWANPGSSASGSRFAWCNADLTSRKQISETQLHHRCIVDPQNPNDHCASHLKSFCGLWGRRPRTRPPPHPSTSRRTCLRNLPRRRALNNPSKHTERRTANDEREEKPTNEPKTMSRRESSFFSELPVPLLPFFRKMLDMKDCNIFQTKSDEPHIANTHSLISCSSICHLLLPAIPDELVGGGRLGDVAGDIAVIVG